VRPDAPFDGTRRALEELIAFLQSEEALGLTESQLEREVVNRGREVQRVVLEEQIASRGPGDAIGPVRDAEGYEHTHKRPHDRTLATALGPVTVTRSAYSGRGLDSLHPFDAELNLPPEKYSLELRRRIAEECVKGSFEDTLDAVVRSTGVKVPKRQLEELVSRAAQDFDAFYEARRAVTVAPLPQTGPVLVISLDGKGVVMRTEDLRPATRKAAEKAKHKMSKRLSRGEKRNRKRMATVATVYTIQQHVRTPDDVVRSLAPIQDSASKNTPPRAENKRVWASLEKTPEQVMDEAFKEAKHRDPDRAKTHVALVDGNKDQLALLKKLARRHKVELTIVLDIIHVIEYLWKAGPVFNEEATPELQAWVSKRLRQVLRGRAPFVAAGIRRSATLRKLDKKKRKAADACARYLLNNKRYLRYNEYLAAGLPIATGVIEGACRHLVKQRMEVSGARWSLAGGEAVLRLRALRSSGDFDDYWPFHEQLEYSRNHTGLYHDNSPPPVLKPTKPNSRSYLRPVR